MYQNVRKKIKKNKYINYSLFLLFVILLAIMIGSVVASFYGVIQVFNAMNEYGVAIITEKRYLVAPIERFLLILSMIIFVFVSFYLMYRLVIFSFGDNYKKKNNKRKNY